MGIVRDRVDISVEPVVRHHHRGQLQAVVVQLSEFRDAASVEIATLDFPKSNVRIRASVAGKSFSASPRKL
jgi:hypothetical protein